MYDLIDILKLAGIGFAIFAIEQILDQMGKKDWVPYVKVLGVVVALVIVMGYMVEFFDTVQTLFTF